MSPPAGKRVGSSWLDAGHAGRVLPVRSVLRLQQTIGNREVVRLLTPQPTASSARPTRLRGLLLRFWPLARLVAAWR